MQPDFTPEEGWERLCQASMRSHKPDSSPKPEKSKPLSVCSIGLAVFVRLQEQAGRRRRNTSGFELLRTRRLLPLCYRKGRLRIQEARFLIESKQVCREDPANIPRTGSIRNCFAISNMAPSIWPFYALGEPWNQCTLDFTSVGRPVPPRDCLILLLLAGNHHSEYPVESACLSL
jgi:hypothetical protein